MADLQGSVTSKLWFQEVYQFARVVEQLAAEREEWTIDDDIVQSLRHCIDPSQDSYRQ